MLLAEAGPPCASCFDRQRRDAVGNLQRDELVARQIAVHLDLVHRKRQVQIRPAQHNPAMGDLPRMRRSRFRGRRIVRPRSARRSRRAAGRRCRRPPDPPRASQRRTRARLAASPAALTQPASIGAKIVGAEPDADERVQNLLRRRVPHDTALAREQQRAARRRQRPG